MSYAFRATHLQKLYGFTFTHQGHTFEIQPKSVFRARAGLEAYGVKLIHTPPSGVTSAGNAQGQIHSFLKIFKQDIPERRQRTAFLAKLGLAKSHWAFQGVPYALFPGHDINGVQIVGHLTKFLGMQFGGPALDFAELKEKWDIYTLPDRTAFATHLASAVDALERSGIVHGDLSHSNIMVGPGPKDALVCCLCDYDGFAHANIPQLPRKFENQNVRPLGARGYQYPELVKAIAADTANTDDGVSVRTDRFALAVLICEMIVWTNDLSEKLGRTELFSDDMIQSRDLAAIPADIRSKFPIGFDMLQRALSAPTFTDMPSPREWLGLLGMTSVIQVPFTGHPKARLKRRNWATRPIEINIINDQDGDFGVLNPRLSPLAGLRFLKGPDSASTGSTLKLSFADHLPPAAVRRAGSTAIIATRSGFQAYPGDTIIIADWEISFEDSRN